MTPFTKTASTADFQGGVTPGRTEKPRKLNDAAVQGKEWRVQTGY